jgi:hypothetical protein
VRYAGAAACWLAGPWNMTDGAAALARRDRAQGLSDSRGDKMKRYKYQALVRLLPEVGAGVATLPSGTSRMVIKAEHRETHASKLFSSLVTRDDTLAAGGGNLGARDSGISVTFVVLGDDASDYLGTGELFALWDGHDLGLGVVTRRIFV